MSGLKVMTNYVVLTYQYVRHHLFLHFPELCIKKPIYIVCVQVNKYRLIQVAAVPLFDSCGS